MRLTMRSFQNCWLNLTSDRIHFYFWLDVTKLFSNWFTFYNWCFLHLTISCFAFWSIRCWGFPFSLFTFERSWWILKHFYCECHRRKSITSAVFFFTFFIFLVLYFLSYFLCFLFMYFLFHFSVFIICLFICLYFCIYLSLCFSILHFFVSSFSFWSQWPRTPPPTSSVNPQRKFRQRELRFWFKYYLFEY